MDDDAKDLRLESERRTMCENTSFTNSRRRTGRLAVARGAKLPVSRRAATTRSDDVDPTGRPDPRRVRTRPIGASRIRPEAHRTENRRSASNLCTFRPSHREFLSESPRSRLYPCVQFTVLPLRMFKCRGTIDYYGIHQNLACFQKSWNIFSHSEIMYIHTNCHFFTT